MMSLRAFARAAPRITSRINSTTATASFRPALQSAITRSSASSQLPRCFSTSFRRSDDAAQELAAKLHQEIQLETEENASPADSDSNIAAFTSQNPHWSIHDIPGEQEVTLTRKYDDETITVSFNIVDFNTPAYEQEEADEAQMDEEESDFAQMDHQSGGGNTKGAINQGRTSAGNFKVAPEDNVAPADRDGLRSEEDEQEGGPAFPANVNVLVQRKGKGALKCNLIADNGIFTIQSVTHLPDSSLTSTKSPAELLRDSALIPETENLYTGPPFQQLDEEVQSLMEAYLDVRGINTALALFVPEYIDVKEQREYLGWLGRVRGFVE
ncbi:hypothetical protein KC367_g6101 [Hortaea werneckii]|uniref:Mitochondrial glyco protein n=2 Tax=Hortaea werneckii TaxID=91943 RepID=A0A3M7IZR7_HORWE|nr:hypothetical protein KC342_g18727 [Hortaea werneckii]OTA22788.1 hypothetical protein BTJ68_13257 [Hortaea werneckii EXF-2000]KAI6842261.1 hypothetical protein KC350_g5114 [Hortaea werneckii]KAI6851214.1 hypothetical protein KC358_g343 [Hortaea werneckii]KAI6917324.1 hypothetical protein KC341_g18589 [Hortaea werneckii]